MKDYTLYYWPIFFKAEEEIRKLKTDWTERQLDLHRATVGGFRLIEEAFLLHQHAIKSRDWDTTGATLEQLHTYVFNVFSAAVERMQKAAKVSTKSRQSGKKGKGAKRETGHDWYAICRTFDAMWAQGKKRSVVIAKLARDNDLRKDVLNRGLRARGRGSSSKIPLSNF